MKQKSPSLPEAPQFQPDPTLGLAKQGLYDRGITLTSPDVNSLPSILQDVVSTNPEVTRLSIEAMRAGLEPQLRTSRQDIINQLEANNQLTGSTTASALGNIQSDYESKLVEAGARAGIEDINRAFANRVSLYGTGLNALQAAGSLGATSQGQANQFALDNYQNQVAKILGEQKQNRGGLAGAISGGMGGLGLGIALAPFTGGSSLALAGLAGAGALAGGLGPAGTGGALFQSGAGLAGSRLNVPSNPTPVTTPQTGIYRQETLNTGLSDASPYDYRLRGLLG